MRTTDSQFRIKGKGRRATIKLEKVDTIETKFIDQPGNWIDLDPAFRDIIASAGLCAGKDMSKYVTACSSHANYLKTI